MTAIHLFLLDELSLGEAHGHELRLRAQDQHTDVWTDIKVGGVYAALKRLTQQGYICPARHEAEGHFPERTIYGITPSGRTELEKLRRDELHRITFRMDPFDVAFTRAGAIPPEELRSTLLERRDSFRERASDMRAAVAEVDFRLNAAERHTVHHLLGRLDFEVDWHDRVLADFDNVIVSFKQPSGVES